MADTYLKQAENPNEDLRSFDERFEDIVEAEWLSRYNKKLNRFIRKATLKYPYADFDKTLYEPDRLLDTAVIEALQKLNWIPEARNMPTVSKS